MKAGSSMRTADRLAKRQAVPARPGLARRAKGAA